MATNRVQFQRGLSMTEFFERYGTEDKCRDALAAARWPRGFVCPACGGAARSAFEREQMRYWQCAACAHQTSLISGTMFQGTKLALRVWFQAMQLLTQSKNNVSALELRRQLGVEPGSVTPLALINDGSRLVRLALDRGLTSGGPVNAHPLVNTMTTAIAAEDLQRFFEATGHVPLWLDFPL